MAVPAIRLLHHAGRAGSVASALFMIVGSSLNVEIGERALLRDASFVVGAGEKVGLVGRNGAGKSSFI